jgi:hypothetical protein
VGSKFYLVYNTIIANANIISEDGNTTSTAGVGVKGDYAPGDARMPKALFKGKMFRRQKIKGVLEPKKM